MKRIQSLNGYTIYQATSRDTKNNFEEGTYYIYFSSDIRDYGISYSDHDAEFDTLENALDWCNGSKYAIAREIAEQTTTVVSYEQIEEIEKQLENVDTLRIFIDENNNIITIAQLQQEYNEQILNNELDNSITFAQYINNCTCKNGTLTEFNN